jgi:ADP-sugar diphosphatase
MSTFTLPKVSPSVEVTLPSGLTKEQLLSFIPFNNWLETLRKSLDEQSKKKHMFHEKNQRYTLRSINVHSVDWFGNRIGFVKLEAVVQNNTGERPLPGIVFLRGGSVAILMIIRPEGKSKDERKVVMTQQPRIPAGSLTFYEIPAGMIDDEKKFSGAAAKELKEETGLEIPAHELIDMTALALKNAEGTESHLQRAMYPSPGGCDEYIALFLWEGTKPQVWIDDVEGRLAGVDREKIKVKLVKYEELWKEGARDAKTLAAWALYEGLTRQGAFDNVDESDSS